MVRKIIGGLLLGIALLNGETLYIGAAGNTAYLLPELIAQFQKEHPNYQIKPVIASSGKLTLLIEHGAPFQLFLSANMKYPETLYRHGFGAEPPKVYAYGLLALATKDPNFQLKWENLRTASKIAIANPKVAPYGAAAVEALQKGGLYPELKGRLVYSENVTGVIPYLLNGVPVGIVAKSALYSAQARKLHLRTAPVPRTYYTPIAQGVLLLKKGGEGARAFYKFLFSKKAREIFRKFGYLPPQER
jgi:molybdate transport system substrate-binding protein